MDSEQSHLEVDFIEKQLHQKPASLNQNPMAASTSLSPVTTSQLCSSKNGLSSPSLMPLLKCVKYGGGVGLGKDKRMKVLCMATSIPADDRVPYMEKRQFMNLLLWERGNS